MFRPVPLCVGCRRKRRLAASNLDGYMRHEFGGMLWRSFVPLQHTPFYTNPCNGYMS
jgi:hypothetical protein